MHCPECAEKMQESKGDYLYVESGLDNVLLCGIPILSCPHGHSFPAIPNIRGLHKAIAEALLRKPALLTGKEMKFLRKHMGLKAIELARLLGLSKQRISQLENEHSPVAGVQTDRLVRAIYVLKKQVDSQEIGNAAVLLQEILPRIVEEESARPSQFWPASPEQAERLQRCTGVPSSSWLGERELRQLEACAA
ncbi:MAG: helix-turn-helix domain-containing protein [Pseudomonadota bacterium]